MIFPKKIELVICSQFSKNKFSEWQVISVFFSPRLNPTSVHFLTPLLQHGKLSLPHHHGLQVLYEDIPIELALERKSRTVPFINCNLNPGFATL